MFIHCIEKCLLTFRYLENQNDQLHVLRFCKYESLENEKKLDNVKIKKKILKLIWKYYILKENRFK